MWEIVSNLFESFQFSASCIRELLLILPAKFTTFFLNVRLLYFSYMFRCRVHHHHRELLCHLLKTIYLIKVVNMVSTAVTSYKIMKSLYRAGQALRVPGSRGSQISRHSSHDGGKVVSPTPRPPLPPPQEIFLVLISARGYINPRAIVRPEGLCKWKIPMTPSGVEPATFCLVAQCLNQLRTVSQMYYKRYKCSYVIIVIFVQYLKSWVWLQCIFGQKPL